LALLFFVSGTIHAQVECKVLVPALSGKYEGGCKRGLAHGKGIAEGIDHYEGRFVKGYPHGKGRYDWSTGEYYEGDWKKGLRDGKGSYHFRYNEKDTVYSGLWENDKYIGPDYPRPKITQQLNVARVDFTRVDDGQKVEFSFYQGGNPASQVGGLTLVCNSGSEYNMGHSVVYNNVIFPFNSRITFGYMNAFHTESFNAVVDLIISEPGFWKVKIHLL